jgi:hypothetical protein
MQVSHGAGEYKIILTDGKLVTFDHWDKIPSTIKAVVKFAPHIPRGPHSDDEHDLIYSLPEKMRELMSRCRQ